MENTIKKSILVLLTSPLCLFALGGKPQVVHGQADYEVTGPVEVVRVSDKTILEYSKFNIEKNETTRFEQPSDKSTLLCRVKGRNPSAIHGKLEANGKLLFVNPNGVFFSETAYVNVGTLIASTLGIQNEDFLAGRFKFQLDPDSHDSAIVNKGHIEAAHNVVFMAPKIVHEGIISAKAGKIALTGGEVMTLDFDGDNLIQFAVEVPLKNGFIEQAGELNAGQVFMKLGMAQQVIKNVLNVSGIVEAGHIEIENGVICLKPGSRIIAKALDIEGHTLHVNTPIAIDKLTTHMSEKYVVDSTILVNNNALIFDAPLLITTPKLYLSTGDLGGHLTFLDRVEAAQPNTKLTLSAGSGDISFHKPVSVDHLNIVSAHNTSTHSITAGTWIQNNVTGITTVGGPAHIAHEMTLQGFALNLADSVTVDLGSLTFNMNGHVKSSEHATIAAASISQKGDGTVFLGGTWIANAGGITIEGNGHLLGSATLEAPLGEICFNNGIEGLGGLTARSQGFTIKGAVGRIAHLKVETDQFVKVANIGKGNEGIEGELSLHSKGSIYFEGKDYIASGHDYRSDVSFEFIPGQHTTILNKSMAPTVFQGAPINLGENGSLEIRSNQGAIQLAAVHGKSGAHFTASTPKNNLTAGLMQGIDKLHLQADSMTLNSPIDVGSIHMIGKQPVHISQPITARTGDFIVEAPLVFDAGETLLQALLGKCMRFEERIYGNTKLTLHAPEAEIILKNQLNGPEKFQQINLHGKRITQYEAVASTGPVHYTADYIKLGHDIICNNSITLDGAVQLFKNNSIHLVANKFNKGPITLTSTLDADRPFRTLTFQNEKSLTHIKGAIGKQGPLGGLVINSGRIVFGSDIGGATPGVVGRLKMKSVGIECRGSTYHTGEQLWNTTKIAFIHQGAVEVKTAGGPLFFGNDAKMDLVHTTGLTIQTNGGRLDLAPINSDHSQPITIQTGAGEIHLKEIGKNITKLQVEGRDVYFAGHIEADEIFMQADHHIEYDPTKGGEVIATALQSTGPITLNSKFAAVGSVDVPINVETTDELFVGAKTVAYLVGNCADQYPHVYQPNPAPRTFFNGNEYNYLFLDDHLDDDPNLKTIAPALAHKLPSRFMDGVEIKPRKAPIYYDSSSGE